MNRLIFGVAILALGLMLSACGDDPTPIPQPLPAPPPQTNGGGGNFFGGGGNCGVPGGSFPLRQDGAPYIASLTSLEFNSVSANTLSLNMAYYNFTQVEAYSQSIVGGGNVSWPDLTYIHQANSQGFPQQGQIPYSFCVSSTDSVTGQIFPGGYVPSSQRVAIDLHGIVQVPVYNYNPYSPYPGGGQGNLQGQTTQQKVTISIGPTGDYGAVLNNGRIEGYVLIELGGQRYWYYMQ